MRLLNLVNFGGEGTLLWAEFKGDRLLVTCDLAAAAFTRPPRLSPLQADTLLLAVELLGGQLPTEHGAALAQRGAEVAPRPQRRPAGAGRRRSAAAAARTSSTRSTPPSASAACCRSSTGRPAPASRAARAVEPMLLLRSRGRVVLRGLVPQLRGGAHLPRGDHQGRRSATRRSRRATTSSSTSIAAKACAPAANYAAECATLWHSPAVARWIAERETVVELADGACLSRQPYVDTRWLVHEVLR